MITHGPLRLIWILPMLSLGFDPRTDSSETAIGFAVGSGAYGIIGRGCDGTVYSANKVEFETASGFVEHTFEGGKKAGIRLDHVTIKGRQQVYVAPGHSPAPGVPPATFTAATLYGGFTTRYVGADAGFLFRSPSAGMKDQRLFGQTGSLFPMFQVRLGRLDWFYLEGGSLNAMPLLASAGRWNIGVGLPVDPSRGKIWIGADVLPYAGAGMAGLGELRVMERVTIRAAGRMGFAQEYVPENGISLGLRMRID